VDVEAAEQRERRDEQDAPDPDRADEEADQRGDCCEDEAGNQPAAKLVSSLVSSTTSFFRSA